jgi:SH3 domain protein
VRIATDFLRKVALALAGAGVLVASQARAETLYVIEQLFVSVNAAPDGSGERVGQIKSGDPVELIERQDEQAHVRLASGEEGWVKASYLSPNLPMNKQLAAKTEELEKMRKEKAQLETDLAAAKKAATAAAAAARNPPAASATPAPAAAAPTPPASTVEAAPPSGPVSETASPGAPPLFPESSVMPSRPTWLWAVGCSIVSLAIGFALGWRLLDRRIRAKYGGLRIY